MATNSSTAYAGVGTKPSPAAMETSQQQLALDNLMRRELKVSDPHDSHQVAAALLERYKTDPRAKAISSEAKGVPFLLNGGSAPIAAAGMTSTDAEWQQAVNDVDCDLRELTSNSLVKDTIPELRGWAQTIHSLLKEGFNAAKFALDPRQRDKAFGIRRHLNDYARVSRLIGANSPGVNQQYRSLARSLDEAAAVILVLMGEALANIGFGGGRYLLQAPYSELQVRRDAVIYALRNLLGSTQEAYGQNEWPRGLDAYRRLFKTLEEQGYGDLRALMTENELARIMDELIQRASPGDVDGLRALGSTAQVDLARIHRLVAIGKDLVKPESPPYTAFLESLLLFAEAFDSAGGFRLVHIARPPILLYGLYGIEHEQQSSLQALVLMRGAFAEQLDHLMDAEFGPDVVMRQMVLDKVLYDVDRAIDLYAQSDENSEACQARVAAYGYVIDAAFWECFTDPTLDRHVYKLEGVSKDGKVIELTRKHATTDNEVYKHLLRLRRGIRPARKAPLQSDLRELQHQELAVQKTIEQKWEGLVSAMAPRVGTRSSELGNVMNRIMQRAIAMNDHGLFVGIKKTIAQASDTETWGLELHGYKPFGAKQVSWGVLEGEDLKKAYAVIAVKKGKLKTDVIDVKLPPDRDTSLETITWFTGRAGESRDFDEQLPPYARLARTALKAADLKLRATEPTATDDLDEQVVEEFSSDDDEVLVGEWNDDKDAEIVHSLVLLQEAIVTHKDTEQIHNLLNGMKPHFPAIDAATGDVGVCKRLMDLAMQLQHESKRDKQDNLLQEMNRNIVSTLKIYTKAS